MNVTLVTKPSKSIPLSFSKAGVIAQRLVNDGDQVKKGQLLVKQDTDVDVQELNRPEGGGRTDARASRPRRLTSRKIRLCTIVSPMLPMAIRLRK